MQSKYEIIKELGRGGFGHVYLAREKRTGRKVAIKVLQRVDEISLKRFMREGKRLYEQLDNEFVVDFIDCDFNAKPPYIVIEYCEFGSLRRWVTERHSWEDVASALLHAAIGLSQIHSIGGFHRDIKPDNLLLGYTASGNWIVKVADFGLARVPITSSGAITKSPMGTEGYIAPEVLSGYEYHSGADIFSLGITGIELLTGMRSVMGLATQQPPLAFNQLLLKMIAPHFSQRPNIHQLIQELERILRSTSSQAVSADDPVASLLKVGGALLIGLGVVSLLGSEPKQWDGNVKRYRGSNGKFCA